MQKNCFCKGFYCVKKLLKWLVIGIIVGLIVGTVSSLFGHALLFVNGFRARNPLIVLGLPVAGIVIVFLYRFSKDADDKGTNMVITSIQSSTDIPFRMMPLIFVSTVYLRIAVAACGMVGLFCGVTNSPLTSLLIAFELFGFEGMPYFLVTVAVSYMLSGYFGLYRAQMIMYSKTEDHVVDTCAH